MTIEHHRRTQRSQSRGSKAMRWSLGAFLALGAMVLVVAPVNVDPIAAQEGSGSTEVTEVMNGRELFPIVGGIDFRDANGEVLGSTPTSLGVDPELHLAAGHQGRELYLVDTRSLAQVGILELPFDIQPEGKGTVLDTSNHRFFFTEFQSPTSTGSPRLGVVDLTGTDPMVVRRLELAPETDEHAATFVAGPLAYDAGRNRLYLASSKFPPDLGTNPTTTLHAVDVPSLLDAEPDEGVQPMWSLPLHTCGVVATKGGGLVQYNAAGDFISVGCLGIAAGRGLVDGQSGHSVVRVDLRDGDEDGGSASFNVETIPFPGNLAQGFAVGDPANGLAFISTLAAGDAKLFVLDVLHRSWTGSMSLVEANTTRTASDPSTGRIYQFNRDEGLLQVTEGERVVVPNGSTYDVGLGRVTLTRPAVDPGTRRIFVMDARLCLDEERRTKIGPCEDAEADGDEPPHWRVLEDRLPDAPPPPDEDWDERTEDVDPDPETTSSQYSGNAQGFGATYTFVGGIRGMRPFSPPAGFQDEELVAALESLPAGAGPRHLYFGRADYATMSGNTFFGAQTSAKSAGFVAGNQTKNDYSQTGGQYPDDTPEQFRAHPSACNDFGGSPEEQSEAGSAVVCDSPEQLAQAAGRYTQPDGSSPFQIGDTQVSTTVTNDDTLGLVSRAHAEARDVTVGVPVDGTFTPLIRIGEVVTHAEAVAHGQPGTAATTLEREIRQVVIGPPGDAGYECGFGDGSCDPYQVVEAINELAPPKVKAYIPAQDTTLDDDSDFQSPDDAVSNGTPGGAKATVQKDPYRARSDEIMQSIGDPEVPGLVIEVYDDHDQPSRHVLHLAGVALDANFFIQSKPTWEPWPGPGPGDVDGGDGDLVEKLPGGGTDIGPAGSRIVAPPPPAGFNLSQGDGATDAAGEEQTPSAPQGETSPVADDGADPGVGGTSQGEPPALDTVSEPGSDGTGAPAPEVAPPAGEDVADSPQAANEGGPAGLFLTRQRLGQSAPLAALWLLGAAPFYLAVRRRQLTNSSHRR